jgi:monofunctional biosynthetic peptidoglycan transglycosylase
MKRVLFKSLLVTAVIGAIFYFYASLPEVSVLKKSNPKTSALMQLRDEEFKKKGIWRPRQQVWVPYEAISEHLKKAILVSEDASFFSHKALMLLS